METSTSSILLTTMLGEKKHKIQPGHLPPEFSELKVEWDLSFFTYVFWLQKTGFSPRRGARQGEFKPWADVEGMVWVLMTCLDPIYSTLSKSSFILTFPIMTVNMRCFSLWFKMSSCKFIQLQIKISSNELVCLPNPRQGPRNSCGITLLMVLSPNSFSMLFTERAV